jgi:hypothetical protein
MVHHFAVHWLSLEIGYESNFRYYDEDPVVQKWIEEHFRQEALDAWARGGHTAVIQRPVPTFHSWAGRVIESEINTALHSNGKSNFVTVDEDDVCWTEGSIRAGVASSTAALRGATPKTFTAPDTEKDIHTRCKLRGEVWVNSRTYRLRRASDGGPWIAPHFAASAYFIATLSWRCNSVTDASKARGPGGVI